MESGYPTHYVSHNLPLVTLFGLGTPDPTASDEVELQYPLLQQRGFKIFSELPDVTGPAAEQLLNCFLDFDARDAAWNNRPGKGKMGTMSFTFRSVGRAVILPPHKAAPPDLARHPGQDEEYRPGFAPVLHSPISPLSPSSSIFPDGLMTSLWFTKHQVLLPSTLIAFFNFTLDEGKSTLQDNKLKNEINSIRSSITSSGYKLRLVVVLVTEDEEASLESGLQDRLANIRRATSLDPKSLHFVSRDANSVELRAFVGTVLAALQPLCMEYYRDLSKHARRKRSRNSIPPPTAPPTSGTSQTLSSQGWNVRYETKMGFFAEYRQEMDAACRNYEAAYEALFDGEVFESIAGWSPRFEEARLLADTLAIRILRCLLWTGQTTSAVMSWVNHRTRTRELVDRKGKGTTNYGWEAWEARWAKIMSEVIEKVDLPNFDVPQVLPTGEVAESIPSLFAVPEKSYANEQRLRPWDRLHHPGYWLANSAKHTRSRRQLASGISTEDQIAPEEAPASAIAGRARLYDTYLCSEPHVESGTNPSNRVDHESLMIADLKNATEKFRSRQQLRAVERLQIDIAQEYANGSRWQEAMDVLQPLWLNLTWRKSGWWEMVEIASRLMEICASKLELHDLYLAAVWERLCKVIYNPTPADFLSTLDAFDLDQKPHAVVASDNTAPTFSAAFVFERTKGNVGITTSAQLIVTSNTHAKSPPINLSDIDISFEGGFRAFRIKHSPEIVPPALYDEQNTVEVFDDLRGLETRPRAVSQTIPEADRASRQNSVVANLEFKPGQTKVFSLNLLPREAGEVRASQAILWIRAEKFDFELRIRLEDPPSALSWWQCNENSASPIKIHKEHPSMITILPKPPKLDIALPDLRSTYYIAERLDLPIQLQNMEDDAANVKLSISLSGSQELVPTLYWTSDPSNLESDQDAITHAATCRLEDYDAGEISPEDTHSNSISFQALQKPIDLVLVIRAEYSLSSDSETTISKHVTENLSFIGPFEANYDFNARLNPEPWPSYFHISESNDSSQPQGLEQLWTLDAKIASFAVEPLVINSTSLEVIDSKYATTTISPLRLTEPSSPQATSDSPTNTFPTTIAPKDLLPQIFPFTVQKPHLEDRHSALSTFHLRLTWHRPSTPSKCITTTLLVPPLTVPFGEPRVLVSSAPSPQNPAVINLTYTLENPSSHFLSFSLTMETSEEFAFSGAKTVVRQLVPVSRCDVRWSLLPVKRGVWIWPRLRVLDTGFGQELRAVPAEGCRGDGKRGVGVWVDVLE